MRVQLPPCLPMPVLHIKGAKVTIEEKTITMVIPKATTKEEEAAIKKHVLAYLVAEAFVSNLRTREVVVERI